MGAMFPDRLELFGQLRIADFIGVKVADIDPDPMLHFAYPQLVQERSPPFIFRQILGHMMETECVRHRHNPSLAGPG